jgi:Domain of unknown function (DUF4476)
MKTIFTLLASTVLSASVFAADARPKSSLVVTTTDRANIRVTLDGKNFEPNNSTFRIDGIDDGFHTIKVYKQRNSGIFNMSGRRFDLVYNTTVSLKKRTETMITIERNGRASILENRIGKGRDWNDDRDGGYNDGRDGQWGDYDTHEGYADVMNAREFNLVLQSIDKEWLESNKLKSATQVAKSNALTAAQVKQMVQLFSFENNKVELAKQAYDNTVDKRNYSIIFDVFSFSTSKSELERYIRTRR